MTSGRLTVERHFKNNPVLEGMIVCRIYTFSRTITSVRQSSVREMSLPLRCSAVVSNARAMSQSTRTHSKGKGNCPCNRQRCFQTCWRVQLLLRTHTHTMRDTRLQKCLETRHGMTANLNERRPQLAPRIPIEENYNSVRWFTSRRHACGCSLSSSCFIHRQLSLFRLWLTWRCILLYTEET